MQHVALVAMRTPTTDFSLDWAFYLPVAFMGSLCVFHKTPDTELPDKAVHIWIISSRSRSIPIQVKEVGLLSHFSSLHVKPRH